VKDLQLIDIINKQTSAEQISDLRNSRETILDLMAGVQYLFGLVSRMSSPRRSATCWRICRTDARPSKSKALRKLRHPSCSDKLKSFFEGS